MRAADDRGVMLLAFRRLVGMALAFALLSAVAQNLGPALAARSMGGYVDALHAAQAGDTARASSIGDGLARQWQDLSGQVTVLVNRAGAALQEIAP